MELRYLYYIGDQQIYYGLYIAITNTPAYWILEDTLDVIFSRMGTSTDIEDSG